MQLRAVNRLATFPPDYHSVFYAIFRVYTNHEKEPFSALRKILCKKESKQIRKQITNMVFRLENGGIHLPVLAARSMLYAGMRTAGVNNGIRHRTY